jgi:hypothetical protein
MRFLSTSDPDLNRVFNRIGDAVNSASSTQDIGMVSGTLTRSASSNSARNSSAKGRYFAPRMDTMA